MPNTMRSRLPLVCLAILAIGCFLVADELVMLHAFGMGSRELSCSGKLRGAAARHVCIKEKTVVKISKPCTDAANVFFCKWTYWKQVYTNTRWVSIYSKSPLIPDVVGNQTDVGITMERVKFAKDQSRITPDYKFNMEKLRALDEMLEANGHLALDVLPDTNVLLDDTGKIHIVDFNLVPSWTRSFVDNFDTLSLKLSPFTNIYGSQELFKWLVPRSQGSRSSSDIGTTRIRTTQRLRGPIQE
jgi:hypothetical protein